MTKLPDANSQPTSYDPELLVMGHDFLRDAEDAVNKYRRYENREYNDGYSDAMFYVINRLAEYMLKKIDEAKHE